MAKIKIQILVFKVAAKINNDNNNGFQVKFILNKFFGGNCVRFYFAVFNMFKIRTEVTCLVIGFSLKIFKIDCYTFYFNAAQECGAKESGIFYFEMHNKLNHWEYIIYDVPRTAVTTTETLQVAIFNTEH